MDTILGVTGKEKAAVAKAFDGSQVGNAEPEPGVVLYDGPATRRLISKEDWKKRGIEANSVEWGFHNKFRLPLDKFTEEQLKILRQDVAFKIGE